MTRHIVLSLLSGIALSLTAFAQGQKAQEPLPYQNPKLSPEERADDLLGRLDIDQKAKLMTNYSFAVPELGIRAYNWWNEALHGAARAGLATSFPQAIGMAASWDVDLLQEVFDIASTEQRIIFVKGRKNGLDPLYHGLTVWTPNINIFRDPRWGRGQETYGEDPYLTAKMGAAVVRGLQGEPKDGYDKLHACLKHYAVHSGLEYERHHFDVSDIPMRDFRETYLYAFEDIIKHTDVQEVMCAYNSVFGKPCCDNDQLLTRILREEWGYKGLVVSDCSAIRDLWSPPGHQPYPGDPTTAISHAVRSGTDLECGKTYRQMADAIREGKIDEKDVDVSLRRLLVARFRLGEMDPEESVCWNRVDTALLDCPAHRAKALEMAHESMVLLHNTGILPLAKEGVKYAVMGVNAKDEEYPLGNYKGEPAHVISAFEGICNAVGADSVTENPDEADIVIYVGGINPRIEGEEMPVDMEGFFHGDRTSIELPKDQRADIAALKAAGKRVVYVNYSGSAMALAPEKENCEAILQAWYAGEMCGEAIADVLFGDYNPSGRLPVTFYASDADLPEVRDYHMEGRTYRYFYGEPLWYFGYGQSYTTFKFGRPRVRGGELVVKVRNTGRRDGDEVVQMYVSKKEDADGPKYALRGFKRVSIPAGKSVVVRIPLSDETWATYDETAGKMTTTPGHFTVYAGPSANPRDLKKTRFRLR